MRICFSYDKNGSFQDTVLLGLATAQAPSRLELSVLGPRSSAAGHRPFSLSFLPDFATTPPGTMLKF